MTGQQVLDLFEEKPLAVVPCCDVCGARGPRLEESAHVSFNGITLFALVEIAQHKREMHGVAS